ncbi:serine hydrolase [Streptomyces ipomoeae]|uniref:serine hydrolase domain-containing protein n=1 Tax=Streptomyces ipomoeae TaxID=103232 RepID=UPI001146535C|nr:serine hydrolase domain-containing protein [Streptomyces ipomoeae]MDX2699308.1 serine hydrolase [Streptomyces ipomoeae]MDX2828041.1 serine hydrolase [Streptomyces ipomoeae]MDX2841792.1 serine hydrolase [Streptomyces ipomoeae]MDX2880549.1 serine hydrolase [Streptomyces ipomoeae]TQE38314.1 class A beta-lactamase-related serine hydrolase [Streptomyces ipomoeae]
MDVSRRRRGGPLVLTGLVVVLLAASTGLTAAAQPQRTDPLQQQVDVVHDTGTVGVFAEVTSPDTRDIARAGTAEMGTSRPMPRTGRFRIGSAAKTFTATVVLQLVDEGRMSLEDTIEQWLPGVVRGNGNDGSQITVRQLLQHTSGIPDVKPEIPALNSADGYRAERFRTYTPEELVELAMQHRPNFSPGEGWSYSNTNYILAAMIIHQVTGRSWAQEVNGRIIRPLGLGGTSTPGAFPFILGPHAQGYAAFGTDTSIDVTALNPSMAVGSGSIISTTHDLNRFYTALLGGRLLDPAQLDEMTTTTPAPELGVRYGLGLGEILLSCGGSYFGHLGELLGYHTLAGVTRDGTRSAVVYVTSDGGQDTQQAMSTLVDQELCRTRS